MEETVILVIEDNPVVLECILAVLELNCFRVIYAENGRQGIELARQYRPDAIVSDFEMPDLSGLEVLKHVRRIPGLAEIPFIIFTAHGSRAVKERCLGSGVDVVVDKGTDGEKFIEVVHLTLSRRSQQASSATS